MKKYLSDIYFQWLLMISLLCNVWLLSGCEFIYVVSLSASCAARPELSVKPEKWPIAVIGKQYIPITGPITGSHHANPLKVKKITPRNG